MSFQNAKSEGSGGTPVASSVARIIAIRSLDLAITVAEVVVAFDPAQTVGANGLNINAEGNLVCITSGYYQGSIKSYIDESTNPNFLTWGELKPAATGVWEVIPPSLFQFKISDDSAINNPINGGISLLSGDEVRFKARVDSGTSTITTVTDTVALGTVVNYAATLNLWRVGPPTP